MQGPGLLVLLPTDSNRPLRIDTSATTGLDLSMVTMRPLVRRRSRESSQPGRTWAETASEQRTPMKTTY